MGIGGIGFFSPPWQGGGGGGNNRDLRVQRGIVAQCASLRILRETGLSVFVTPPAPPCEGGENSEFSVLLIRGPSFRNQDRHRFERFFSDLFGIWNFGFWNF